MLRLLTFTVKTILFSVADVFVMNAVDERVGSSYQMSGSLIVIISVVSIVSCAVEE